MRQTDRQTLPLPLPPPPPHSQQQQQTRPTDSQQQQNKSTDHHAQDLGARSIDLVQYPTLLPEDRNLPRAPRPRKVEARYI
eukprot:3937567-Rhodomonas_salina.1